MERKRVEEIFRKLVDNDNTFDARFWPNKEISKNSLKIIKDVKYPEDFDMFWFHNTAELIKEILEEIGIEEFWEIFHPYLMMCIPTGGTSIEKRAAINAGIRAGARKVFLIEEPKAAAIGANLDITGPGGNMVVDVGGGTTDIAVLSLGDIVTGESLRVAGNKMDEAIMRYVRKQYNVAIGELSAELIKKKIGYAIHPPEDEKMEIRGRDLVTGLPKRIEITAKEICEVLSEPLSFIINGVKAVLERTPPELAADIIDRRIVLTGGGSLLKNFDLLIKEETGIPAILAEDPISCVAIGTGKALKTIKLMKEL